MPKRKSRAEKIRDAEKRVKELKTAELAARRELWRAEGHWEEARDKLKNARARLRRLKGQKDAKGKRPK